MTKVKFAKLESQEKLQLLCQLTEELFQSGQRILLIVYDDNQAVSLDRYLWTWDRATFLPHAFDNGSVQCIDEPIVVGVREENPNGATVLIMGEPCSLHFLEEFKLVIDFAEVYDPQLAEQSRERFRIYRDRGFTPSMY